MANKGSKKNNLLIYFIIFNKNLETANDISGIGPMPPEKKGGHAALQGKLIS